MKVKRSRFPLWKLLFAVHNIAWASFLIVYPDVGVKWWAFSFFRYISKWFRLFIAFTIIMVPWSDAFLVCLSRFVIYRLRIIDFLSKRWFVMGLFAFSLFGMFLWRERTIWGDGLQIVAILEGRDMPWNAPFCWCWHEPLTWLLEVGWYKAVHAILGWDGVRALSSFNLLLGALCVPVFWSVTGLLGDSTSKRLFLFGVVLSIGAVQVLFGHIENYTMAVLFSMASLSLVLRAIKSDTGGMLASFFVGIAVAAHLSAAFVVAIPWLWLICRLVWQRRWRVVSGSVLAAVLPIAFTLLVLYELKV